MTGLKRASYKIIFGGSTVVLRGIASLSVIICLFRLLLQFGAVFLHCEGRRRRAGDMCDWGTDWRLSPAILCE